jgi:ABC-2 type transport system ATP-binding protein
MAAPEVEHDRRGGEPAGGTPALAVSGARRSYGARVALAGVDLELPAGMIYGLLGPNGAGKTTLVRAISGRLRLDRGSVRLCGEDPANDPRARRLLGLVPQELALYPELTAAENLQVFGRLMGLSRAEAKRAAQHLLERIGLGARADDRVDGLSGGMKRRLNVAAGVIHRPRVLLLDEPTVGVDPAAREDIHELLRELRDEGLAVLLTTHDLEQAAELADRVGLLIDGELRVQGTVAELVGGVFGDGKELLVTLAAAPAEPARLRLEALGLAPSRDRRVWTRRLEKGLDDLSGLTADLDREGLEVAEVRVREPGLRGVFFRLAWREIDA